MEYLSWIPEYLVPFLIIITILVFVHEMGHYLIAKRYGVKVEVFSIGFGRELFGWNDKSGTRWKFSLIPMGGYVKMFGDADPASTPSKSIKKLTPQERACSLHYKSVGQRSAILFGGPLANFIFAIFLMSAMFMSIGQPYSSPVITDVVSSSAAEISGMKIGDRLLSVDGRKIGRFEDLQMIVQSSANKKLKVVVNRNGQERLIYASPQLVSRVDNLGNETKIGVLGIKGGKKEFIKRGFSAAIFYSCLETYRIVELTLAYVGEMILGSRSGEELAGPLGIAKISGDSFKQGFVSILWLSIIISINLGLINLFPIPLLDGGHLLFYAIEAIRGKALSLKTQEIGFKIGLILLFSLMFYATWNDLSKVF